MKNFRKIDPILDANKSKNCSIERVNTKEDLLEKDRHLAADRAFYLSDRIARTIANDFSFVERIPALIERIIDNKSWKLFYVCKGVKTPYYCGYTKGTDSENFRAFIEADRPNGLGTTIETIECLLELLDPIILEKFEAIVYDGGCQYAQINTDNPRKAADRILQIYDGQTEKLTELIRALNNK